MMDSHTSNVILMRIKCSDFFVGIIVEDSDLHIVRTGNEPRLARNKFGRTYWQISHLERLDQSLLEEVT